MDVVSEARSELVERLCGLGAQVVSDLDDHVWLRDPEGNDFCLTDPR
ncbi:MAG: hypothetical protein ACI8Y4_004791 [Candidatus Poriferisodalaceae bacterium]|jgi:hypothetical protein